jgi:hypothetical protein
MHAIESKVPGAEYQFWKVVDLHDEERRLNYAQYYKVVENTAFDHDHQHPCRISYSAGREFDCSGRIDPERPIFFVKFSDHNSGRLMVRQPIGIGALLEIIATWTELLIGEMVISSMPEADGSQLVERHIARGEYLRDVYDEELTDYSAAIHMLSVRTGTKDMFLSYSLGALVASVALNLPEKWYPSLLHPKPFEEFGKPACPVPN